MQKPNGYEEATTLGAPREEVSVGGHHLIIKQVNETMSKGNPQTGSDPKPMIVVLFDIAPGEEQAGIFMKQFKEDTNSDKKWPFRGTQYIMVQDWSDPSKTSKAYKTFCTAYEKSNGCSINWVDDSNAWSAQFKGKKIGGMFGKVHSVYNGREYVNVDLRWFLSDDKVDGAEPPMERLLSEKDKAKLQTGSAPAPAGNSESWVSIPEGLDEELPFK